MGSVLARGPLGHHDDIARQNRASWCVTADGARGIDTDFILAEREAVRRWSPERKHDDIRCFHATHSSSVDQ
jgi:hypothetical protein